MFEDEAGFIQTVPRDLLQVEEFDGEKQKIVFGVPSAGVGIDGGLDEKFQDQVFCAFEDPGIWRREQNGIHLRDLRTAGQGGAQKQEQEENKQQFLHS